MSPQVLSPARGPVLVPRAPTAARRAAAGALQLASHLLAQLARRLATAPAAAVALRAPELEFHAEAGAPEGALYADGVLVALLPGVTRL